eukprot:4216178-Prymnesium_polylepis.1
MPAGSWPGVPPMPARTRRARPSAETGERDLPATAAPAMAAAATVGAAVGPLSVGSVKLPARA